MKLIQRAQRTAAPLARSAREGFTLAELMVVIVILGLLATLVVPNVLKRLTTGQIGKAKADITSIVQALDNYAIDNGGHYPDSLEALVTPDDNGETYINKDQVPRDPWGNEYSYEPPTSGQPKPKVTCYGKDGVPGGDGKDKDFDNFMIQNGDI